MFSQKVTLYNRYGNDSPTMWGRTVLSGVHWQESFGASASASGASGAYSASAECLLIIPKNERYRRPEVYQSADDRTGIWTLQPGDAIIPGEGPDMVMGNIKKALPACKLITGMTAHIYGSPMDNWEVTAK